MTSSGSITQGSPISPPTRLSTDQQQYPSTANNHLVNPRYSCYMNKSTKTSYFYLRFFILYLDEPSSLDHSPKGIFARRAQQVKLI
jgi:hypothetical protein